MCIIAGYAGGRDAAPILIEMLKKTEYIDGGLSTGIATVHGGRVHMRKVVGDVETLLRDTDALSLPGTVGIIHSRTAGNHVEHAHPFMSADGSLALVLNGTTGGGGTREFYEALNREMDSLLDGGIKIKSAVFEADDDTLRRLKNGYGYHDTEPYALLIGEKMKNSTADTVRDDIVRSTREVLEAFPIDVITLSVHKMLPDTITVGTVSRPMSVGFGDGETFACTTPFGLPEYVQRRSVVFIQPTTLAQITPRGLNICSTGFAETRVEQIDFRIAKEIRQSLERYLKVGRENAIDVYDLPLRTEWDEIWSKPLVESKYALENSRLKPIGPAIYEGLWSFYREGRLRYELGTRISSKTGREKKIMKFWLEE